MDLPQDIDPAAMLASGQNPQTAMLNALASSGRISPEKAQMMQMFMAQNASTDSEDDADQTLLTTRPEAPHIPDRVAKLIASAEQRLMFLEGLLESVADALGACPACLGADDLCEECDGEGHPGTDQPDRESFENLILPVLHRLKRSSRNSAVKRATARDATSPVAANQPVQTVKE